MNIDLETIIKQEIQESINVKQSILRNEKLITSVRQAAEAMIKSLKSGGKIITCGNGGSASDALHIAGELLGRFQKERKAYAAVSLNSDVATMTAIANDYGYENVFARQVQGLMLPEDVLFGISTSGNSENVIRAFEQAKNSKGMTILLAGRDGGTLKDLADISIVVPGDTTAHIQEAHICIYHVLCELIEQELN